MFLGSLLGDRPVCKKYGEESPGSIEHDSR